MSDLKYRDTQISITLDDDWVKAMGDETVKKVNACETEDEAYDVIYNQICSIMSDYTKLSEMGLVKENGGIDFDKIGNVQELEYQKVDEEKIQQFKDWLSDYIQNSYMLDNDGYFMISSSSYDDYLSESTVGELLDESLENEDDLKELLFERLLYNDHYGDTTFINDVISNTPAELREAYEELVIDTDLLSKCGYCGYDYDVESFLNHTYKFNLMLDTGNELRYDDSSISRSYIEVWNGNKTIDEVDPVLWDNGLTMFLRLQGYDYEDVFDDKKAEKSPLLKSVRDELDNAYGDYNYNLTVLCSFSGKDLLDFAELVKKGEGTLTLGKTAMVGLYDRWNGAGSCLDITAEKDIVIPANLINKDKLQLEGYSGGSMNWTVDQTYELVGSAWQESVKIDPNAEPPVLEEKITKKVKEEMERD